MICYVYVLYSPGHRRFYIGISDQPDVRFKQHNAGKVKSTRPFRPWTMLLLEEHASRSEALKRERYLKSGWGRRWLKKQVQGNGLAT